MSHHVMIFGAGDVGSRIAEALLLRGRIREVTLIDLPGGRGEKSVDMLASCHMSTINFEGFDALDRRQVEAVIRHRKPDLIVQAATLRTPLEVVGDPIADALHEAGMAVQLGYQFPVLYSVMQSVKEVAPHTPVANVTFPDLNHHVLNAIGLAPTAGLASTGIIHMRTRISIWRHRMGLVKKGTDWEIPKIRIFGGHPHVYDVWFGRRPEDPRDEPLVFLGESGSRNGDFTYAGTSLESCPNPNMPTSAASIPVIEALLPGADDCESSMAGPCGLLGGYPVKIADQEVTLDLPVDVSQQDAEVFNANAMRKDGVERVDGDGTIHYTGAAKQAMSDIAPALTEPYNPLYDRERTNTILELMDRIPATR
jgi:hypothetical protein